MSRKTAVLALVAVVAACAVAHAVAMSVSDCNVAGMWQSTTGRTFICTDQKEKWWNCFCLNNCGGILSAYGGYYHIEDGECEYYRWNEERQNGTYIVGYGGERPKTGKIDFEAVAEGATCIKGCASGATWTFFKPWESESR